MGITPIFIDECAFDYSLRPIKGKSKRGTHAIIKNVPRSKNLTLLAAVSMYGLEGYMIFGEPVKTEDFVGFLVNLIKEKFVYRDP